ncbi:MAG: TatD family hydrolase [Armatimonadota bacterium]|nr:TatD family hydrolase [Armatimonadota bacterium]MDR7452165.1 TatD family hydrolase [Armatimonadota bacterium]MDR7468068.1 TatD family hydrolase [Armatimonadota bacterium]MDR7494891.1 TatD family hydrolase [Armatimonadota bacterium]MDR7500288.1 TatD family hydrolase [Armatimonadota bacterium]
MELFDSHLHLEDRAFDPDREQVLARARAAGVVGMVTVGSDVPSSAAAVSLADRHPDVYAAVAVHPQEAEQVTAETMDELRRLAAHPKVVAVGETGLDYVRGPDREIQRRAFRRHLRLAAELSLPAVVHCREAFGDVLDILGEWKSVRAVLHAFSGSTEFARRCVQAGYVISLGGPVTYRNARQVLEVARCVPAEALLLETDAPVLTPEPFRGRRNEPAYLVPIAARLAALRGVTAEEIAGVTTENARKVFRLGCSGG